MHRMFGGKKVAAEATVLSAGDTVGRMVTTTSTGTKMKYEYIVEVRPADGEPFRTKVQAHFYVGARPQAGETLRVRYNPKNQETEFDLDGDERYDAKAKRHALEANLAATKAARDQALLSGAGTAGAAVSGIAGLPQGTSDLLARLGAVTGADLAGSVAFAQHLKATQALAASLAGSSSSGEATITAVTTIASMGAAMSEVQITAQVQPETGDPFEASFPVFLLPTQPPLEVGGKVPVIFDPADHSRILKRPQAMAAGSERWKVPEQCPECGARVDQSVESLAEHPMCHFCQKPLPCEPVAPALGGLGALGLGGGGGPTIIIGGQVINPPPGS
ncbi:MAG: hypothetical protein ACYDH6_15870 [Acidimicrobiales bacterium]